MIYEYGNKISELLKTAEEKNKDVIKELAEKMAENIEMIEEAGPVSIPSIFSEASPEGTQVSMMQSAHSKSLFPEGCLEVVFFDCSTLVKATTYTPSFWQRIAISMGIAFLPELEVMIIMSPFSML